MVTARRLAEDKDDFRDIVTVLENLNRLTGQSIIDISSRAILIVRLLEIRREPANREIPRQLSLHCLLDPPHGRPSPQAMPATQARTPSLRVLQRTSAAAAGAVHHTASDSPASQSSVANIADTAEKLLSRARPPPATAGYPPPCVTTYSTASCGFVVKITCRSPASSTLL